MTPEDSRPEERNIERSYAALPAEYIGAIAAIATAGLAVTLDAIFPMRCKGCEAFLSFGASEGFCPACSTQLRLVEPPYCLLCGQPYAHFWVEGHLCAECLLRPPAFLRARSWVCYPRDGGPAHPVRRAVHRFKYGRKLSYGKVLGQLMARACKARFGKPDLIVPVPLHAKRLRWRGFNQAAVLGTAVSRCWHVPLDPLVLEKSRPTRPQTELSRRERLPNVRGAFSINPRRTVKGRHLLLVDDIYTSGATVKECTRVLLRGGARTVQVLTLGRTV